MSKVVNVNIDSNIISAAVAKKRQMISQTGALLGRTMQTIEARSVYAGGDEGFEKDKAAIAAGGIEFMPNRSPRKLMMKTADIISAEVIADPVLNDQVCIQINGEEGITIPLTEDMITIGEVTNETVAAALKGERQAIFLNANKLVQILNRVNNQEAEALQRLIEKLSKMRQSILNAVVDNERKAKAIDDEWTNSAVTPDMSNILKGKAQGIVEISVEQ